MAELRNYQTRAVPNAGSRADTSLDEGLRAYMIKVYNLMALVSILPFASVATAAAGSLVVANIMVASAATPVMARPSAIRL